MIVTALALLVLQARTPQTVVRDSTKGDTTRRYVRTRLAVTPSLLASAFKDDATRELFTRARRAHAAQDSSIMSYDAKVRQRLSVSAALSKTGPERLAYRSESAARIRWQRGVGAQIEMTGNRVAVPVLGSSKTEDDMAVKGALDEQLAPLPYSPGSESLWIGGMMAQTEVNDRTSVNPLADGAEAYYIYAIGDSLSFRLGDGTPVSLRELVVRPRVAQTNVVVGSLWFDVTSGQLVRAAYRFAAPLIATVSVSAAKDDSTVKKLRIASIIAKALMPSGSANISAIAVEYGLYEGRYWLPRTQTTNGTVAISFVRAPITWETAFDYTSVNGPMNLAPIHVDTKADQQPSIAPPPRSLSDSARKAWVDSTHEAYEAAMKARADSTAQGLRRGSLAQCDTAVTRAVTQYRNEGTVAALVRVPCDPDKLIHSPDFTKSIYDPEDQLFGTAQAKEAIDQALTMAAQAPIDFGLMPPAQWRYGLSMTRYNRVEGLSTGLRVDQQIGGGYAASALWRYGFGDRIGNGEVSLMRTNFSKTIQLTGYKRLAVANDWGDPLSFNASLASKLFARDEGFYYRAVGGEARWTTDVGPRLEWRAFTERETTAPQTRTTTFGSTFIPNIFATPGQFTGLGLRYQGTLGEDPRGFRLFTDLRVEGAKADSAYGRAALDLTVAHQIGATAAVSLTVSGGTSVGSMPAQRLWYLGGTQTIRGLSADPSESGNAFWMTRGEVSKGPPVFRVSLFGDLGWVGDRNAWREVGRPLSSVGVGFSSFDGLVRLDVARGIFPTRETRLLFYFNPRF